MFKLYRFPEWFGVLIGKLYRRWNTRIVTENKQGCESSEIIHFKKGLPQGDSLSPTLFILCLNPIAWKLRATSGYKLSKPISCEVTHLLYIDDLKMYGSSESNLERVMRTVKGGMDYIGLKWNEKKCVVVHVKRGCVKQTENIEIDELKSIRSLGESTYKFLGVLENSKQEDKLVLEDALKEYLCRLAIIWSSPLSDHSKVVATNQYAPPVLSYLMWTQTWPLAQLQQVDREVRKIMVDGGGNHPQGSTAIPYMSRKCGGRGLRSVETTHKGIKNKAAMKLYCNPDPCMEAV